MTNPFSSIPFQSKDYDGIEITRTFLDQQGCFKACNDHWNSYDYKSRGDCNNACSQPFPSKILRGIFDDVAAQEKIYQSATQKLTSECEFWKNIVTTLTDESTELFSLDAQKNVSWELSLFPDASDVSEKVQVFRNGVPDYCLNSPTCRLQATVNVQTYHLLNLMHQNSSH